MNRRPHPKRRTGSALLLCTLATAIVSLAAVAILRSSQQSRARIEGQRAIVQSQQVAEGLLNRAIATLADDPYAAEVRDPNCGHPDAVCRITHVSSTAAVLQVFMYSGATPVLQTSIDPTSLAVTP